MMIVPELHNQRKALVACRLLWRSLLVISVVVSGVACTRGSRSAAINKRGPSENGTIAKGTILDQIVTGVDEDGSVTEVQGYSENGELKSGEILSAQDLVNAKGERVFEFNPPEGYRAEFSPPIPISGANLIAGLEYKECIEQTYQPKEPTSDDILSYMKAKGLCGRVAVNVCVKLATGDKPDAYFRTPALKLDFVCPQESFTGITVTASPGAQAGGVTPLAIAVGPAVKSMYITNSPGCGEGGTWQPVASDINDWLTSQSGGSSGVYAKFRDFLGNESECIKASEELQNTNPGAPSAPVLSINSGDTITSSNEVTLGIGQVDGTTASFMYITNTAGCSAGGVWEAFAGSKAWTLAAINGTANVYAALKDAKGQVSSCATASIVHDNLPPTAASLVINGGAVQTSLSTVNLTLAATDAFDMLITNTAGCTGGGTWEAYASTKAGWTLGQSNTLATVYAQFRDAVGNTGECLAASIVHDDEAPVSASLAINSAATYTNSGSVSLAITGSGITSMYITNTPACAAGGSWEAYAASKLWTLAQTNGAATVYAKFKDATGNESACVSDSIMHDDQAPAATSVSIAAGASHTNLTAVTLSLAASDATEMYLTHTLGCGSGGSWEAFAASKAWTLAQTNTTATVYVKFKDAANNESACANDTIIHDSTGPSATSVAIAANATYTATTSVALTLAATDAAEMYVTNTAACSSGGSWEAFSTSKAWTLSQTNTSASVYVKFKDAVGNESACGSDTIIHDSLAPSSPSLLISAGDATVATTSTTLTLAASDASEMYVTDTTGCAAGGSWEAYATSKAWTLAQTNTTVPVFVKFRDLALNETACVDDTIIHDSIGPTATSVAINSGASYASSTSATLTLAATDAVSMYITDVAACGSGGVWETYATSKAWTLAQTNATATVYVKFKDSLNNESSCESDTIVHDSLAPTAHSVSIAAGAASVSTSSVGLALAATGASDMYVTNTAGCASGGAWEAFNISKASWSLAQSNATATVYVKFKDGAGNETTCVSDTILHDAQAPTSASIVIASAATHTASSVVALTLAATDASSISMYVTNTAGCSSDGSWESYATSKTGWSLGETNATATVYVKFKDDLGNETSCLSDSITHDSQAPTAHSVSIAAGAASTASSSVNLTLAASGASDMYVTNTAGCASDGTWEGYATSKTGWGLGQSNGTATVYIKYKDSAGNETSCVSDTIVHDGQAPTSASISIASAAAYTASTTVTLTLAATDASSMSMYITNTAGCGSDGSWESYATSKSGWTLGQTNTTATVYVKFKDDLGNEGSCVSDTIIHDNQVPTISIESDATSTTLSSVDLAFSAVGMADMYITNTAGCASGGAWEAYATTKTGWGLGQTNATATVYAKFKDASSNETVCVSDAILHDAQAPASASISIASAAAYTVSSTVALTLAATDASSMSMYITNTAGCGSGGAWESYATSKAGWSLGQTNATATVYAKFKDDLGNETACLSDTIVHDDTAPTSHSLSIAAGAASVSSSSPNLTLAATGASDMYITNTAGCGGDGTWETYATSKTAWSLGQTNATATVYVKYKDAAGNETTCVSDTILHDAQAPVSATISIAAAATYSTSATVALTLAASDASGISMYITNTSGCGSGGAWESYATSKSGWTLGQTNATATVYAKFKDDLGNETSCQSDTIIHDDTAPSSHSLAIAAGAASTSSSTVSLTPAATGASDMYITNTAGCASGGAWETYATSKAGWSLGQSNATATIYVKYKDTAGNESSCVSDTILHDAQAPTSASVSIASAAAYTTTATVALTLAASDASSLTMYITNIAGCGSGGTWETYDASKSGWTLGQTNATATVYAKFKDDLGQETSCVSDTIIHDSQAPTSHSLAIAAGAAAITSSSPTLTLAATGANDMYITNTAGCGSDGAWETYATSKTGWSLGQTNTTATVYVKYKDTAGNETTCVSDTVLHDSQAPTSASVSIAAAATYTTSTSVALTLAASDASSMTMYVTNTAGCASGGAWESYATSKTGWTLAQTNATATVYAKFKDDLGNETGCLSDTIIHDDTAPTSHSLSIAAGAASTSSSTVSLTPAATGASDMYITNTSGCGSGGAWETYATSKTGWSLGQTNATATVYVKYKDGAGNETSCVSDTILHDAQAPASASISIASAAAYTTTDSVALTLGATDASSMTMYITNTSGCGSGGAWESYATSKSAWTLAQTNATATVYVKFKDDLGNETSCLSDTIVHDDTAPSAHSLAIAAGAASTSSSTVSLTPAATGASDMYITNTAGCGSGGAWETYATSKTGWSLDQTNATATVYVKYKDTAGNQSSCVSDSIVHDSQAPTSASISIASAAAYTTTATVALTLAATDASSMTMYVTNTAGCASGGSWEAYATSKTGWTLTQTNATATVYAKFKDDLGFETSCLSDTIIHDDTAPTSTSVSIAGGATYAGSTSVSLTLAATGGSDMYITNTSGCGSGGAWETYATSKAWTLGQSSGTATVYAKFKDAAGNTSSCINDTVTVDATAPSVPASMNDGTWARGSTTSPALSWGTSTDTGGSGLAGYQLAIGTTAGGTNVIDWADIGNVTTASVASLSLTYGSTYYVSVRAVDNAGNTSAARAGDGFIYEWHQEAYIKSNRGAEGESFGVHVSLSSDTVAVGSYGNYGGGTTITNGTLAPTTTDGGTDSGAMYIFKRSGLTWAQESYIKAANAAGGDKFGATVSIDGNTAVAAAPAEDSNEVTITNGSTASADNSKSASGALYVYLRSGTAWSQQAYIKTVNAESNDKIGDAVAISGDTLAASSIYEKSAWSTITNGTTATTNNNLTDPGAVYVYKRTGTTWAQEAYVKPANVAASLKFGTSVSLSGDTMVVGAIGEDSNQASITNGTTASTATTATDAGAAYVYVRTGTVWAQQAYLKPTNARANMGFGQSIAVDSDTVAVGAPLEDSNQATITNGTASSTDNSHTDMGAAYVFKRTGTTWAQEAYIKSSRSSLSGASTWDGFGYGIALSGDNLAVGAHFDNSNQTSITNGTTASTNTAVADMGAVYTYKRSGATWVQEAYIKPANGRTMFYFGSDISLSGDTLAVGMEADPSNQTTITNGTGVSADASMPWTGAVFIYRK